MRAIVIHYGTVGTMKIHYCIQLFLKYCNQTPTSLFPCYPCKDKGNDKFLRVHLWSSTFLISFIQVLTLCCTWVDRNASVTKMRKSRMPMEHAFKVLEKHHLFDLGLPSVHFLFMCVLKISCVLCLIQEEQSLLGFLIWLFDLYMT